MVHGSCLCGDVAWEIDGPKAPWDEITDDVPRHATYPPSI
jgi:hypothetical protein